MLENCSALVSPGSSSPDLFRLRQGGGRAAGEYHHLACVRGPDRLPPERSHRRVQRYRGEGRGHPGGGHHGLQQQKHLRRHSGRCQPGPRGTGAAGYFRGLSQNRFKPARRRDPGGLQGLFHPGGAGRRCARFPGGRHGKRPPGGAPCGQVNGAALCEQDRL